MAPRVTPTTVEVNGFAGREIRVRSGIEIAALAEQVGVTRAYLCKIELGHSRRMSPKTFEAWRGALGVTDRRVLVANPHADAVAKAA